MVRKVMIKLKCKLFEVLKNSFDAGIFILILIIGMILGVVVSLLILGSRSKQCPECGSLYFSESKYCRDDGSEIIPVCLLKEGK